MPAWLNRLLGIAPAAAPSDLELTQFKPVAPFDPDAPKRTGATVHPLVAKKMAQRAALGLPTLEEARAEIIANPGGVRRARGVGIVWDANGRPKITADWVNHLDPIQRAAVDRDLARRGWQLNSLGEPERIT